MKAVVYCDAYDGVVESVDDSGSGALAEAMVRISSGTTCSSDLHTYGARTPVEPWRRSAHEPLGDVEEVGSGVPISSTGDQAVVPFTTREPAGRPMP